MAVLDSVERKILVEQWGKWLWVLRSMPDHAAHWLTGIHIPPHERYWIRYFFSDYTEKNTLGSRGSSKSFAMVSLCAPLVALLYSHKDVLAVSASGFRGGKLLFLDSERLFQGYLRSQNLPDTYMMRSVKDGSTRGEKVIRKEPDNWTIDLSSRSFVRTVPTNDPVKLRGIRANVVIVDERNTFDGEVVQTVIRPMMNVGGDFLRPASSSDSNQILQISTIDYTVRDWYPEIEVMRDYAKREYEAQQARKAQDWDTYDRIYAENRGALKTASFAYSRFDYTDLLIPEFITDNEGDTYQVDYPYSAEIERSDVLRYDERDGCSYFYTYPVEKNKMEEPLINGTMDEELWAAEHRNVFISSAGNVFPVALLRKISDEPIYQAGDLGPNADEFYAPVMMTCGDPCVLGVDYARETDESAFTVIRIGELSEGKFAPDMDVRDHKERVCLGKTSWNNVLWSESHKRMTANETAEKIRQLYERYNIIYRIKGDQIIRGIGLDRLNSGVAVRDELAQPKPPSLADGSVMKGWQEPFKIFDPEDEDYEHYSTYSESDYLPVLECLTPSNQSNHDMVMGVRAMFQNKKLYIAKYKAPSDWAKELGLEPNSPLYQDYKLGYTGVQRLVKQLVKIQREITESGRTKYTMPGNKSLDEGKKDLFSSLIYSAHMARQHLLAATVEKDEIPLVQPILITPNRSGGHSFGRGMNIIS